MRLGWRVLIFLAFFGGISVYVSSWSKILSVDEGYGRAASTSVDDYSELTESESANKLVISNSSDHLLWFLQISDIHISRFGNHDRLSDFRQFCDVNVKVINPDVVVATGDLTDGKTPDMLGSTQYEQEWQMYSNALTDTGVLSVTTWLDIRGNHDDFNVFSANSSNNYYRRYSVQGSNQPHSYIHNFRKGHDTYSFVAVDACPEPGPRRPFNFVGLLKKHEMERLKRLSGESKKSNATIYFGHYPTSTILSADPGIRSIVSNGLAYLCGHLHTLGGLVLNMYTLQQTGNLELELADWKDRRTYRLLAIDHGILSFSDQHFEKWPVILVTNPKGAQFVMPKLEPLGLVSTSTHARVLIFSPSEVDEAKIRFDSKGAWIRLKRVAGDSPLYVAPWKPSEYSDGVHVMEVYARDVLDRESTVRLDFSLDGSRVAFQLLPRVTLMTNMVAVGQGVLAVILVIALVPLLLMRIYGSLVVKRKFPPPRRRSTAFYRLLQNLSMVAFVDQLFYPLVFLAFYVPVGPWFFGEVIEGHLGFCFAWGIYVGSDFVPGGITFIYGALHLLFLNVPLTLVLGVRANQRQRYLLAEKNGRFGRLTCVTCFLVTICVQVMQIYGMYLSYGTMASILCPLKTWTVVAAMVLWMKASCLPLSAFQLPNKIYPRFPPITAAVNSD